MKKSAETLEISKLKPHLKCFALFEQFDKLKKGESFILRCNQDPTELYHHLLAERPEPFSWERQENGPVLWSVKISKPGKEESTLTIAEMAIQDYKKAELFQTMGINYCCGGNKSLEEACEEIGLSTDLLEQFMEETTYYKGKEVHAFDKWEVGLLADYILSTHHTYIRRSIPVLLDLAGEFVKAKEETHFEAKELVERLNFFLSGLSEHLETEEKFLFPLMKKMANAGKNKNATFKVYQPALASSIKRLERDHEKAGVSLKFFRELTHHYRLPEKSCDSCTHLYVKLMEFENDLIQHVHLENNILFPKAIALEKELMSSKAGTFAKQHRQVSI